MKRLFNAIVLSVFAIAFMVSGGAQAQRQSSDDESLVTDPRVQHRHYQFPGSDERIPYALFVPETYDASRPAPLIISLHGLGRSYDWLMGYEGFLDAAEAGGHIVVTPLGYIRRGWYGSRAVEEGADVAQRSEQDVMNVLEIVRKEFTVDENRIYLWGHSMGGAGAWHIAIKNPDLFAGVAVVAAAPRQDLDPAELAAIKHVPVLVMHGDNDETVPVTLARKWVAGMQSLGMQHIYIEVAGGDHSLLISQTPENMRRIVDFFNIVSRSYEYK
jgi:predicted peptidase